MTRCNMDCFNCTKPECDFDGITPEERKAQDEYDSGVIVGRKYGRELVTWNYNHSEKGKARQRRYDQSEKGKERAKRKQQKQIASGKNAAYCRAYYYRKKAEREAANG